jgi:hypothetical protein
MYSLIFPDFKKFRIIVLNSVSLEQVSRGVDGTRGSCLRIKKKKVPIPVLPPPAATFAIIRVQAVRTTIVDHILGLHLPLAQVLLN